MKLLAYVIVLASTLAAQQPGWFSDREYQNVHVTFDTRSATSKQQTSATPPPSSPTEDFLFSAEINATAKANGGIFFRGNADKGSPRGFEIPAASNSPAPPTSPPQPPQRPNRPPDPQGELRSHRSRLRRPQALATGQSTLSTRASRIICVNSRTTSGRAAARSFTSATSVARSYSFTTPVFSRIHFQSPFLTA